uniref:Uncharacterized protein n=1 Tax=Moniliophthora roreri TaxID=221103 RepID=A0A0W0F7U2_MONRR
MLQPNPQASMVAAEDPDDSEPYRPAAANKQFTNLNVPTIKRTLAAQLNGLEVKMVPVVSQSQETADSPPVTQTWTLNISAPISQSQETTNLPLVTQTWPSSISAPTANFPVPNLSTESSLSICQQPPPTTTINPAISDSTATVIVPLQSAELGISDERKDTSRMRSLKLYDETALIFDQTTVPDPPRHTFSKDLDELGTLWSDDHPDFKKKNEGKCIVKIQDCGIAYKYWPIVFKHKIKGCEDKRWKLLKKTWYVWSGNATRLLGRQRSGWSSHSPMERGCSKPTSRTLSKLVMWLDQVKAQGLVVDDSDEE